MSCTLATKTKLPGQLYLKLSIFLFIVFLKHKFFKHEQVYLFIEYIEEGICPNNIGNILLCIYYYRYTSFDNCNTSYIYTGSDGVSFIHNST